MQTCLPRVYQHCPPRGSTRIAGETAHTKGTPFGLRQLIWHMLCSGMALGEGLTDNIEATEERKDRTVALFVQGCTCKRS
jgi:hypothetical protein